MAWYGQHGMIWQGKVWYVYHGMASMVRYGRQGQGFASIHPYWKKSAPQTYFEQPINNHENHRVTAQFKIAAAHFKRSSILIEYDIITACRRGKGEQAHYKL